MTEALDQYRSSGRMGVLVREGIVPSLKSRTLRWAVALLAMGLALGVLFVVVATAPFIGFDRHFGFGMRLGMVIFVSISLIFLVFYRASCSTKK